MGVNSLMGGSFWSAELEWYNGNWVTSLFGFDENRDRVQDMGYGVIKVDQSLASADWVFYSCVVKAESIKSIREFEFVV